MAPPGLLSELSLAAAISLALGARQRVIHGTPAAPKEFPHHVQVGALHYPPDVFCGGSLLTLRWWLGCPTNVVGVNLSDGLL